MEKSAKHVFQQIQPISQFVRGTPNRWELTEKSRTYSSSFIIIIIIIIITIIIIIYFSFIEAVFVILKQSSITVLQKPNIIPVSTAEDFLPPPPSTWFCGIWYRSERPNTYNQSQRRRAERSTRLRTWIFRLQSKIGWFLTWIEKKRFSISDYIGFGLVKRNSPSPLDFNSTTVEYLHNGHLGDRRKWML